MRRVQSSIYGCYAGTGPTVVLQTASPTAESTRFGRRRSSLVFTPCPPETPTRSNSLLKLQRAASSFCSVTGWDFLPVGENDVAHNLADSLKVLQHCFSSPCRSTHDAASLGKDEVTKADGFEDVSCFVSCSSPASFYVESAIASPRAPPKSCKSCVTLHYVPENTTGNGCGLAQEQEGPNAVVAARAGFGLQSLDIEASGTRAGEVQTRRWGLPRTRRVVRDMDLMPSAGRECTE
ncbi:hypothetical protein Vretimale_10774 [Volvox reticuliferus]|uniref:Uncharacterized protein n=1 Tax=Volvox reticuliferus TaxID=1737510 RepID=A0A8J4GGA8_9CHLO|nr:hypothetical protein Vretifemale_13857 [Volvox reticuliferus]GIM06458.1 hypothetical protein Vretimale_10774 [Volvox reticuliferus]